MTRLDSDFVRAQFPGFETPDLKGKVVRELSRLEISHRRQIWKQVENHFLAGGKLPAQTTAS